jgi:peptide/nickel transport system substrate-binding protein
VVAIGLVGAALAGCGGSGGGGDSAGGAGGGNDSTAGTPASGTADSNGSVTVAFRADVQSLDPRTMIASAWRDLAIHVYEGLVTKDWHTNADGTGLKIVPALATSWEISPDGKTYTFKLREGVKFHDGTPFDAKAAEFNFRTFLDPKSKYFSKEARANAGYNATLIKSFKAVDDHTFEINLTQPFASFLDRLSAASNLFFISPAVIEKYGNKGVTAHAAGTGPFKVSKFSPGQGAILARNDGYWGTKPGVKQLQFRFMPDQGARVSALQSGEVQIAEGVPIQYAEQWKGSGDVGVIVRQRAASFMCWTNYREGPTMKAEVREALNLGIDRDAMNKVIFSGKSRPSSGYFTPGNLAYEPDLPPLAYDPEKAKQLLAKAGYGNGLKLTFDVAENPSQADVLNIAKENLKAIGIDLKINYYDVNTMISTKFVPGIKAGTGINGQCVIAGGDEDYIFSSYFTKAGWAPNGAFNPGHYTNAKVEKDLADATSAESQDDYTKAMQAANRDLVADNGAWLMLLDMNVFGVTKNVKWTPQVRIRNDYTTVQVAGGN